MSMTAGTRFLRGLRRLEFMLEALQGGTHAGPVDLGPDLRTGAGEDAAHRVRALRPVVVPVLGDLCSTWAVGEPVAPSGDWHPEREHVERELAIRVGDEHPARGEPDETLATVESHEAGGLPTAAAVHPHPEALRAPPGHPADIGYRPVGPLRRHIANNRLGADWGHPGRISTRPS